MALPALTGRERQLYKDRVTFYRQQLRGGNTASGGNNTKGWYIAPLSDTDSTPLVDVPCNFHATWNFDVRNSAAGMSKIVNTDSEDDLTYQRQIIVKSLDRCIITTRYGDTIYAKVQGDPAREVLVPCGACYLSPDTIPSPIVPAP